MSDALGDALRKAPTPSPEAKQSSDAGDGDLVNLLNGSAEPTDDSPTVISKTPPQGAVRAEDQFGGGLRGRRLAHFELIEPIGIGGMAAVIRARDTQLDRLVALKILPPEMAADPENVRRFHQEARSAARLDHENIARVFFCGEDQRLHFIAFEFVEGENLRTILEKRGRLPVGEALHYMLQVAAGLAHAARRGVVHRDIKPSNIIITPNGRAKLVDMGLARSLDPRHDQGLTQSGVTLGTFDYISPEQALEPRDADVRSDIYSLGCTLYHMLTGQPPVPEGTAAKKLHHHQHVKPADPRQFVPDLPDEAAIILDRMMAKNPKDRYQSPEHLVHHLYLATRKLGTAADVPEGVLAVEAALPSPPAAQPFFLAAVAALAVVVLVCLIEFTSTPKTELGSNPPVDSGQNAPSEPRASASGHNPPLADAHGSDNPSGQSSDKVEQETIPTFDLPNPKPSDLAEFLQRNKAAPEILLKLDDLDLSAPSENAPDLVITNPAVTIRPLKSGHRPTIRDQYRAGLRPFQASLTIESKRCTIENIRFVLNQTGASVPMAILWLHNNREVSIRGCEFIQAQPCTDRDKEKDSRMSSLLADAKDPAKLTVTESTFLGFGSLALKAGDGQNELVFSGAASGGQDAIARRGRVRIEATNCLFGPHAAVFRLEGSGPDENEKGLLRLVHCSVMSANPSAVFDVADGADAHIVANYSLFSNLSDTSMMGMSEGKGAVLLRRASSQGDVSYQGRENRYHQLDHFLAIADASEEAVQPLIEEMNIKDHEKLDTSPWNNAQPLDSLRKLTYQDAFAVNPHLLELRVPREDKSNGRLIGAERVVAFSYLDNLPKLREGPAASSPRELVVQSLKPPDEKKRLYTGLEHALLDAQPGDTIRIQLDGEVKLDPRLLSGEKMADITIRAEAGFHPILTMSGAEAVNVPALFAVCNGKLQLEGLEIRLRPREDDWCAVVAFVGDGECVLKGCLITLERSNRKTTLAVLPHERMKKAASSTRTPRLVMDSCFIRGQGDLLWMQEGHSADLVIDNSLIALSGSLINLESENQTEASARDKDEPTASTAPLTLHLHHVTTFLGENLIRMHAAKDIKGLPRMRCEPTDCLFLPARGDRALVRLDGPEAEEKGLREKLSWESSGRNAYGIFTALLEQQAVDSLMNWPTMSNQEKWQREVSGETNSKYNVKLPDPPAANAAFAELLLPAFRPGEGLQEFGADLAALRALPVLKDKPDVTEPDTEESKE
ncbi:MAG TPA: serine/threonine-protein kinase [Gemmataceae bacterium]|jgi:serine/threonine protein kinase